MATCVHHGFPWLPAFITGGVPTTEATVPVASRVADTLPLRPGEMNADRQEWDQTELQILQVPPGGPGASSCQATLE